PFVGQQNINNYHACSGTTSEWPTGPNNGSGNLQNADGNGSTGMFAVWLSYGIAHAIDGTSNTMLFAEALGGDNKGNDTTRGAGTAPPGSPHRANGVVPGTVVASYYVDDFAGAPTDTANFLTGLNACYTEWQKPTSTKITSHRGYRWSSTSEGCLFNVGQPPNDKMGLCRPQGNPSQSDNGSISLPANSMHPAGVNVLFTDGSVKFVKDSIARNTWWALGTRAKGEVISADSY